MWTFEQSTGKLYSKVGVCVATGYAGGNCGKNPEGKNNPSMQGSKAIGPLPQGVYTIGTPVMASKLGPFAVPLVPDAANIMFGRGGFYCHGDTTPPGNASEGCIIMPRAIREQLVASKERLTVVKVFVKDTSSLETA